MACTRSDAEPSRLDDDENIDLEKSNVLLMGPTGSGMITMFESLHADTTLWFNLLCYLNYRSVFKLRAFFFNLCRVSC